MKFVLLYAALALAVNGGLDGVVTVDTTTLPDTTLTVMETETAAPPTTEPTLTPTTTKLTEKPTLTTSTTSVGNAADSAADTPSGADTTSDTTSDTSPMGPRTTTLYPLLLAPAPLVVTVYASNPDTTTSSSTTSSSSSSTQSPSLIVTPGAAIESTYDTVSAIVTTIPTTYPVTTINGRTITLIDVTVDSLAAAAGKTGGKTGGGVVTLYQTVVSGHTSNIVSTRYSTRTGVVTAHPYETLLPITMTLGGNVIVVTKKTTVTPLNNWGTKWDQLVWIDTTYYSSPAPFTYSAASVTANGAAALTAPVEMLRALSWTWAVAAASAVVAVMAL